MSGNQYKKKVKDALKEREYKLILKHRFETRITNVKQGKAAFASGDFLTAIRKYTEYLETVAEANRLTGIYELRPDIFHKTKDITEMLMISHLYYELAKVYDATGKFQEDVVKCLDQFVLFSINQPFQVVNSEMVRKHLRKFNFKNQEVFMRAYQQIFVKSRKCFVATHCFGDNHPVTNDLRLFKVEMLKMKGGLQLVSFYYRLSPLLVEFLDRNNSFAFVFRLFTKPLLFAFSKAISRRELK
ncbi:MAG: hypothetical protein K2P81_04285 [Bacteriovoracaceae bacterium]|nr:hypothetical protein [Bacteriovoracaceae bacterium]